MEQHDHETCEIIHGTELLNDCLDALEYKHNQTNEHLKKIVRVLLELDLDTPAQFALRQILTSKD